MISIYTYFVCTISLCIADSLIFIFSLSSFQVVFKADIFILKAKSFCVTVIFVLLCVLGLFVFIVLLSFIVFRFRAIVFNVIGWHFGIFGLFCRGSCSDSKSCGSMLYIIPSVVSVIV